LDIDDAIILTLALWVFICNVMVKTVDVYVTLLLIGLLVVAEVGRYFINPETKRGLNSAIYFMLFIFFIIVVRKIMEVLS